MCQEPRFKYKKPNDLLGYFIGLLFALVPALTIGTVCWFIMKELGVIVGIGTFCFLMDVLFRGEK